MAQQVILHLFGCLADFIVVNQEWIGVGLRIVSGEFINARRQKMAALKVLIGLKAQGACTEFGHMFIISVGGEPDT
jgi:hypothetical protein